MRGLIGLASLLMLASCGSETADPKPRADETPQVATPTVMPTETPVPTGPVTTAYPVTVLDDGDGAELCLGGTLDSYPPQCGGPKLIGWNWSEHEGDFEESNGTSWGEFVVSGTFDGKNLTPSEVMPADEFEAPPYEDPYDFTTPCPEPEGGWPEPTAEDNTTAGADRAFRRARQLPDYAGSWIDTSRDKREIEQMDQDAVTGVEDVSSWIVNVQVTGDVAAAEAAIREVWSGGLCVTQAENTERELRRIQDELLALPGIMGSGGGSRLNQVDASVIYDDGSLQAWVDHEYGAGVVVLTSLLVPVER